MVLGNSETVRGPAGPPRGLGPCEQRIGSERKRWGEQGVQKGFTTGFISTLLRFNRSAAEPGAGRRFLL